VKTTKQSKTTELSVGITGFCAFGLKQPVEAPSRTVTEKPKGDRRYPSIAMWDITNGAVLL